MRGGSGSETLGGPQTLRRHRSADHLLCILSMVALLPNGQCQEEAKRTTETGMLSDNGSDSCDSYWCHGGNRWPLSAGSGDSGRGEVGGTSPLVFGVLVLPYHIISYHIISYHIISYHIIFIFLP